jgi:beta-lactamase class A
VIVAAIIGVGYAWRMIDTNVEQSKLSADKLARQKVIESVSSSYIIKRDLPAKIDELHAELALPSQVSAGGLPTEPAVAVTVIDLSDKQRGIIDYNGNLQFTSASTYKLVVAVAMIQWVETGRMTWNSPLSETTLTDCFDRMIINSDNVCPEAFLERIGYDGLTTFAHDFIGMSDVTQFADDNMRTSSSDLALLLQKLYRGGELMRDEHRTKLLDAMKTQRYRGGIPTGIQTNIEAGTQPAETVVADKVGWLDILKNDAAIIFSPKGDYILVIMTNGYTTSSTVADWRFTAALTAWIDQQMNQ